MNLASFHLQARGAFHFGNRGVGIEETDDHAPSDTIFSALCNTMRMIDGNDALMTFLSACDAGHPPFIGSGGFPYVRAGEAVIRFYPAPMTRRAAGNKFFREAAWLSEPLFIDWLNGRRWSDFDEAFDRQEIVSLPEQEALVTAEEAAHLRASSALYDKADDRYFLWTKGDVTRVAVDRLSGAANVYQVGRLHFAEGGGLWCMFAQVDDSGFGRDRLQTLLTHLGDIGLGGERSAGHGQFDALPFDLPELIAPMAGHKLITLSNYHPRFDEMALLAGDASYTLLRRQGWLNSLESSAQRHKTVRMVAAGSVLNTLRSAPQALYGDMVDVTPDGFNAHRVYRCGHALALGTFGD